MNIEADWIDSELDFQDRIYKYRKEDRKGKVQD